MGMVSGILPVVGVPLPMVSYGGTATLSVMIILAILMGIARESRKTGTEKPQTPRQSETSAPLKTSPRWREWRE